MKVTVSLISLGMIPMSVLPATIVGQATASSRYSVLGSSPWIVRGAEASHAISKKSGIQ